MKTKTLTAVSIAALAVPGAALAEGKGKGHGKSQTKSSHAKGPKGKAFTIQGVDVSAIPVTDGKLTGELTLDPTAANSHARKFFNPDLSKAALKGEDTVSFGKAGDEVIVRYVGLQSTDALAPTDKVKVIGKVTRSGDLNIRKITVIRKTTETETQS